MANEKIGTIYYDVVGDTSQLVNAANAGDKAIDQLTSTMGKADGAQRGLQTNLTKTASAVKEIAAQAERTGGVLQGLSGLFAGLVTGAGVLNLINMAEAYNETSERIKMATRDSAEYEMVQQRLIKTANAIYRPLKEAQETYILTSSTLRSMGYETSQALDITDSLSLSFVKNATSSDRAQSAISAFTKSMQKGRVEGDAWESLLAAVPTIVDDIAASSNKSSKEIRAMGVEGKITATMLAEGLRQSLQQNEAAAAGMATTLKDAFNNVTNNLSVFLGEANSATGATGVLSQAVLAFGNNISTVANTLGALGAGALARYIAQTAASVVSSMQAVLAARAQATAELQKAQALVASTAATAANAAATSGLIASNTSAAAATAAHTAAVAGLGVAQRGAAAAGLGLTALLGGPAGIVALLAAGAAAAYLFSDSNTTAKATLDGFATSAEVAAEKLKNMTQSQQELARIDATKNIAKGLDDLDIAANKLIAGPFFTGRAGIEWVDTAREQIRELTAQFDNQQISAKDLDARLIEMVNSYASANGMSQEWTQTQYKNVAAVSEAAQSTDKARTSIKNMDTALWDIARAADAAALGLDNFNSSASGVSAAETKALANMDKALATFGKSGAASILYDIGQARKGLGEMREFSAETLNQLETNAKKLDALQSRKKGGGGGGASKAERQQTSEEQALIEVRKQIEAFGKTTSEQKIFAISEALRGVGTMSKFSKTALQELQAEYQKLAELERNQKANEYLSQLKENVAEVGKMTALERVQYDILAGKAVLNKEQLAQANALAATIDARTVKEKELADALSLQNASLSTQRHLQAQLLKYAMDIDGLTMGSDARAQMAERAQMEQEFANRVEDIQNRRRDAVAKADKNDLARVEKLYDDQLKVEQAYQTKSLEAYDAYTTRKKELDADWRVGALRAIAEYQEAATNTAKQAETAFGNFLKNTEDALVEFVKTGKFSFKSLAESIISDIARMAAKSLTSGFAGLLGSALGSYFGFPTASGGSGGGGLGVGNTGSLGSTDYSLGGGGGLGLKLPGRANGGPVKAGSMYRVNEKGTPELLNVGGNQYLMMGDRSGSVDNMHGGSGGGTGGAAPGGNMSVNIYNQTDSKVTATERQSADGRVLDLFIEAAAADVSRGGRLGTAVQTSFGLNRGAGTPRFYR